VTWWLLGSGIVCAVMVAAVLVALDEYLRNLRP
jgi:hypothetical protein